MGQSLLSYLLVTLVAVHTLQAVDDGRKPHRLARRAFPQPTTTLVSPAYEAPLPSIANPEASVNVNAPNNQALVPQGTNYNQQFKQNSTVVPGTNAFLQTLDDPCLGLPLTSETWKRLDLDNYLSLYPNGQATSLQSYAYSHRAQNFVCGIGQVCNAGQLCSPVSAPDWYVLYAAQTWNVLQNSLFTAVGSAVSMVQTTAAAMFTDLLDPQDHTIRPFLRSIFHLTGAVALTALFGVLISPIALLLTTAMVFTTLTIGTWATLETLNVIQGEESAPDGFATWSNYAYYLSQWQGVVQQQLSNLTATTVRSGISSEGGIYGALKGGAFLNEVSLEPISVYQKDLKQTSTTRLLVDILKAQGAYITYGSDPCNGKGPNGAWDKDGTLSICKNGVMMNIVRAYGSKTLNTWYNANLIQTKYNTTTEYLITQSLECQQKYQVFGYDPYKNGTLPLDPSAECLVNLPVCNCTNADIKHARAKGLTTTRACRDVGHLPI